MVSSVRSDALVDGVGWPDNGCALYPVCLTCPLPKCRYDLPRGVNTLRAAARAISAQRLRSRGAPIEEIMRGVGVSRRQVFRLLKKKATNIAMSRSQRVPVEGGAGGV